MARKKIEVTINGTKYQANLVYGDFLAILGLFFYTPEERQQIINSQSDFADTQLRNRLNQLLQVERDRLTADILSKGETLSDQAFDKELNDRVAITIGKTFLVRVESDYETRLATVQRLREIFPDCKEIWYRSPGDLGLRLEPEEVCDIAAQVFKAFPDTPEATPAIASSIESTDPTPEPEVATVEVTSNPEPQPATSSLGDRLREFGLPEEAISRMLAAAIDEVPQV